MLWQDYYYYFALELLVEYLVSIKIDCFIIFLNFLISFTCSLCFCWSCEWFYRGSQMKSEKILHYEDSVNLLSFVLYIHSLTRHIICWQDKSTFIRWLFWALTTIFGQGLVHCSPLVSLNFARLLGTNPSSAVGCICTWLGRRSTIS